MSRRTAGRTLFASCVLACSLVAGTLEAGAQAGVGATSSALGAGADAVRSLPPKVIAATQRGEGSVIRRGPGFVVETVPVAATLREVSVPSVVYRITLSGWFPPRAQRYVVTSDGRPVAYGVPAHEERSLVSVTADPAVATGVLAATYGGRPVRGASARRSPSAAPGHLVPTDAADRGGRFGPLAVTDRRYNLGDRAFQPSQLGGKVEITAQVYYPKGLPGGPYPLVLFLHGNHSSCFRKGRSDYRWPCRAGWHPMPNYLGYGYIAERLASHGFIVVSVSGNGVNVLGNRLDDTGMRQRAELLERHLELWRDWSTVGGDPFGRRFVGKVDMTRIGTMGHSRGGEGAVWQVVVDRERPDPFGIDAVFPLAPVDFTRVVVNRVPMAVMLPYCDGDVSDLQGIHFFDDARYAVPGDPAAKQVITVYGANHNSFNTVWTPGFGYPGSFDDGVRPCQGRLRPAEQRRVAATYIVSYFRRYVGRAFGEDPIWTGARTPAGVASGQTLLSYLAPDTERRRLDLARFTDPSSLTRDQLGGPVVPRSMSTYGWCADVFATPCLTGGLAFADIHLPGLAQGVLGWSDTSGSIRYRLPEGFGNVRRFDALQFRASINPDYFINEFVDFQDLVVRLWDSHGHHAAVAASAVGNEALAYPPGLRRFVGHMILQQVRFPLSRFDGVDLRHVRSVQLVFSRTDAGVINVADLAFAA